MKAKYIHGGTVIIEMTRDEAYDISSALLREAARSRVESSIYGTAEAKEAAEKAGKLCDDYYAALRKM